MRHLEKWSLPSDALFSLMVNAMKTFSIRLKNKSAIQNEAGVLSVRDALGRLEVRGMERVVAAEVNGEARDLFSLIETDSELGPIYIDSEEGLEILRHSTSHVMAMAVKELFPGVKVTIGPAIDDGFYYDFDFERPFRQDDLPQIEERMEEIIKTDIP